MMFTIAGLLVFYMGLLAQALVPLVPQDEGSGDLTGKRHLTKASTSDSACPGKS
jgi:hypothetical protein